MNILVTGAAGYIGSVLCERLIEAGHYVMGVDNLSNSYEENLPRNIWHRFFDISSPTLYWQEIPNIDCVCHLAADSLIGESTTDPHVFFENNVGKAIDLLEFMRIKDCKNIVFSSTASIYGEALYTPMDENHPINPINAYGESKWMFERILEWYRKAYGFRYCTFRYFNVGGATEFHGENRKIETRLIPTAIDAILNGKEIPVFGNDWNTIDGTCMRDYVHVKDIADAHILGIEYLKDHDQGVFNLGGERVYTVLDIIVRLASMMKKSGYTKFVGRRPGDPEILWANSALAKMELGWQPKYSDIDTILRDSYEWRRKHVRLPSAEIQYRP